MTHLHGVEDRLHLAAPLATASRTVLRRVAAGLLAILGTAASCAAELGPWSQTQAHAWYERQPWLVGANYIPATAVNELEMWQAQTFDPAIIDRELGWAQAIGMNTARVFLHNLLWESDAPAFTQRIDTFLTIAARHRIKPILVLFDSVWDPNPQLGPQSPPVPGVHNSRWVQAPGYARLADPERYALLQAYVTGVVRAFGEDQRVLAWDLWNEPDGSGNDTADAQQPNKAQFVTRLLPEVFRWARAQHPSQPLTSGLWRAERDWSKPAQLDGVETVQLQQSDVLSFHNYEWPENFAAKIRQLSSYGRPILCTEYMARSVGSTFDGALPLGKRHNVAMINWGLVDGKTQTRLPWDSWQRPYTTTPPAVWFHEVLRADGSAYRQREVQLIKALSAAPKGVVPVLPE